MKFSSVNNTFLFLWSNSPARA